MTFQNLYNISREQYISFIGIMFRHFKYRLLGKNIYSSTKSRIQSVKNILLDGCLSVGFIGSEFSSIHDVTQLNIWGQMFVKGNVSINRGSRISVMNGANLSLTNCFINSNVIIQCEHSIEIGDGSAIGWGTQICDEDYHNVKYANTPPVV